MHADSDVFEVNIVDFLLLETLRVFEPDLHAALFHERELLLQERHFLGREQRNVDQAAAELLLTHVEEGNRIDARNTLKELFPSLEWAYGGTRYADDFRLSWLAAKRVCTTRYFPRYFELQTSTGEMSESHFIAFLAATSTDAGLTTAIAGIEAEGLLLSLVARLDESVDRLPIANAAVLLPAMFTIGQQLAGRRDASPFNSPWVSAWRATSWFLKRIPIDVRGTVAIDALRQSEALSVAATLIQLSDPAAQTDGRGGTFDPALDIVTVEAMKAEWLRLMRNRAAAGGGTDELFSEPDLLSQLYRWRDYTGTFDEPVTWVREAIRTDTGFAKMATRFMSQVTSHTSGDRVSVSHARFNIETISDFIGVEVATSRCNAIEPANFPEHEVALQTLGSALEEWRMRGTGPTNQQAG
jgi:hypothetical protein